MGILLYTAAVTVLLSPWDLDAKYFKISFVAEWAITVRGWPGLTFRRFYGFWERKMPIQFRPYPSKLLCGATYEINAGMTIEYRWYSRFWDWDIWSYTLKTFRKLMLHVFSSYRFKMILDERILGRISKSYCIP